MADSNPDPPTTLKAAELRFSSFLRSQNYPENICWLIPGDVVVDHARQYWVRKRRDNAARYAIHRYVAGIGRNLGILLEAICATEVETFAFVFIPADDEDAQNHLMGSGLKFSCPVERYSTSATSNPLRWLWLWSRYGRWSKTLEVNQRVHP